MTDADPLEGADVGETRTVRETKTLHGINMEPDVYYGSDRFGETRIADVEVVRGDDGEADDIRVTWEGDVTKALPRRWDYCREPRTAAEERAATRKKWLGRAAKAVGFLLPVGVATLVASHVMNGLSGDLTINGEPMVAPTAVELVPLVVMVMGLAAFFAWAVSGGIPPMRGVGR